MHKLTRLSLTLAVGASLLTLAPIEAYAPPESPVRPPESSVQSVRPSVCPIQTVPSGTTTIQTVPAGTTTLQPAEGGKQEDSPQPNVSTAAPEPEQQAPQAEKEPEKQTPELNALLAGYTLTKDQRSALRTRLGGDSQLVQLLAQGELTEADLTYLALPNGRAGRLDRYSAWKGAHPDATAEEVVLQVNMDRDLTHYKNVEIIEDCDSLTVLVNKNHALPAEYAPQLEALGSGYGSGSLRPEAAQAFRAMADEARKDGVSLRSVSAYRSFQTQKRVYNRYLQYDSRKSVDTYSARPGSSEHQTGLALDINTANVQAHFEKTPAYAWLQKHCAEYGFILRYAQGKEDITGYRFEPWHYRYVGTEIAKTCMERGLTYEEYLALQPETVLQPSSVVS